MTFPLLWSGQVVSTLGSTASEIIYPLLILALTDSPAAAGVAAAMRVVPYLVFSLPVGALIDRWDRKRVMILCDAGRGVAVLSIPVAMLFDLLPLWQIYVVAFVEGSLFVFFNIAEVAALPRVVTRDQLPEATAQNQAAFGIAGIIGPTLGTFVYQAFGRSVRRRRCVILHLDRFNALDQGTISTRADRNSSQLDRGNSRGLALGVESSIIRYMAILTGGLNFIIAGVPLTIIVIAKQMGTEPARIGLVFSVGAIGGVAGAPRRRTNSEALCFGTDHHYHRVDASIALSTLSRRAQVLDAWCGLGNDFLHVTHLQPGAVQLPTRADSRSAAGSGQKYIPLAGVWPHASRHRTLRVTHGTNRCHALGRSILNCLVLLALVTSLNPHVRNARPVIQRSVD